MQNNQQALVTVSQNWLQQQDNTTNG